MIIFWISKKRKWLTYCVNCRSKNSMQNRPDTRHSRKLRKTLLSIDKWHDRVMQFLGFIPPESPKNNPLPLLEKTTKARVNFLQAYKIVYWKNSKEILSEQLKLLFWLLADISFLRWLLISKNSCIPRESSSLWDNALCTLRKYFLTFYYSAKLTATLTTGTQLVSP